MAKGEYAVGMLNFLSVLDTQRSLFATQTQLIQTRQQVFIELITLYEAMGGGWSAATDTVEADGPSAEAEVAAEGDSALP
jgi:multidrug efflux system outer membrane protein